MPAAPKYKRILLKLSGEALLGKADYGIDPQVIGRLARETIEVQQAGVEVGIVIGGGNLFRGEGLAAAGMDRDVPMAPKGGAGGHACGSH